MTMDEINSIRDIHILMCEIWNKTDKVFPISEEKFLKNWDQYKSEIYRVLREIEVECNIQLIGE
tara:strand:- start:48 stop:239 length:192 start_codon:yes stop_codon:yes gene_type:complete